MATRPRQLIYSAQQPALARQHHVPGRAALAANGTFTQLDINNGLVSYVNDGSANTFDNVNFQTSAISLTRTSSGANLTIQIIPNPVLTVDTGMSVNALVHQQLHPGQPCSRSATATCSHPA